MYSLVGCEREAAGHSSTFLDINELEPKDGSVPTVDIGNASLRVSVIGGEGAKTNSFFLLKDLAAFNKASHYLYT